MVKSAHLGKEIHITVINKIGVLADLSNLITEQGINIEAVAGYAVNNEAKIMLVTSDNARVVEALAKAQYTNVTQSEAVIVELENKPGMLNQLTTDLARESIDIKQIYGTACPSKCPAKLVLATSNNQKALAVFKKQP